MEYLPTFTKQINQMLVNIPYMNITMGYKLSMSQSKVTLVNSAVGCMSEGRVSPVQVSGMRTQEAING